MSHVDERILAAFLDGELPAEAAGRGAEGAGSAAEGARSGVAGAWSEAEVEAHLAGCPECRARLGRVRRMRGAAAEIMSAADPGRIEPPPFSEIAARARDARRAPSATGRRRRLSYGGMAWAASIMVAVAAGWWANQMINPSAAVEALRPGADEPAVASDASARARPEAATGANPADASGANVEEPVPGTVADADVDAGGAAAAGDAVVERSRVSGRRAQAAAPAPDPESVEAPTGRTIGEPAVPEIVVDQDIQDIEIAPTTFSETALDLETAAPTDWRLADREEAVRWIGGEVYTLPGAEVLDYAVGGAADRRLVRTRQRLGDGVMLELVQRRVDTPPSAPAARAARTDPNEAAAPTTPERPIIIDWTRADADAATPPVVAVRARNGAFIIVARAPLPADSIRALFRRLRQQCEARAASRKINGRFRVTCPPARTGIRCPKSPRAPAPVAANTFSTRCETM